MARRLRAVPAPFCSELSLCLRPCVGLVNVDSSSVFVSSARIGESPVCSSVSAPVYSTVVLAPPSERSLLPPRLWNWASYPSPLRSSVWSRNSSLMAAFLSLPFIGFGNCLPHDAVSGMQSLGRCLKRTVTHLQPVNLCFLFDTEN